MPKKPKHFLFERNVEMAEELVEDAVISAIVINGRDSLLISVLFFFSFSKNNGGL